MEVNLLVKTLKLDVKGGKLTFQHSIAGPLKTNGIGGSA
jgi:hypothetical protein